MISEYSTKPLNCLLCGDDRLSEVMSLSGRQISQLWNASGVAMPNDALGVIQESSRIRLFRCEGCGFRFFDPALAGKEIFYRQLESATYFSDCRPEFVRTLQFAKGRRAKAVLDVGCGTGAFLDMARQNGMVTHGLELNKAAAKNAEAKGHIVFNELLSELNPGTFNERFDLITLFQVLEHVPDPVQMMHQAAKLLRPGGCVSVAVPNARGLPALSELQPQQWPPHHVTHWRKQDLQMLAKVSGLKLIRLENDVLLGRDLEYVWLRQRQLARAIGDDSAERKGILLPKVVSVLYRKLGFKFFFPRLGSSIQGYFTNT